ncbi:hypothetical protein KDL29_04645 [bacterium]|nr:hypothetical protein [bacterium]
MLMRGFSNRLPINALALAAAGLLALLAPGLALAQLPPGDVVVEHFKAIAAEEYVDADHFFSREFRTAFKADVARMNAYYRTRREQIARGYEIREITPLEDADRETMRVTVDFSDGSPDDGVDITERIYYYLIRQNNTDSDAFEGKAWRIDIFDALSFDSLADARRRPYLYSGQEWDEFASRELIARQGLFRIQMALESFHQENQGYPFRLLGDDNRRDELINSNKLGATYPPCGFNDRPMRSVQFEEKSSGDFSYYSVDTDGDGVNEGYWLLLHGRDEGGFYFEGRDTIYVLSEAVGLTQREQAEGFAAWWEAREGQSPVLSEVTEFILPEYRPGNAINGAPVAPTMDDLASSISRADPVSGIVENASELLSAGQPAESADRAASGTVQIPGSAPAVLRAADRGGSVAGWIASSAQRRLMELLGISPQAEGSADPLAALEVGQELTIHSFGSWD